jgi:hypothetical protein
MIQIPLMRALQGRSGFSAWLGQDDVAFSIHRMMERCPPGGTLISVDYTNFDASVPREVLIEVFMIIKSWFTVESAPLVDFLLDYFMECPLIVPGCVYKERTGGIPSGSVLTNLVGSLANLWSFFYAVHRSTGSVQDFQVQGDDGVYCVKGIKDQVQLAEVLANELGMVLSTEKNLIGWREVHFLQNVYRTSYKNSNGLGVGVRPLMRVLNGMLSYERFKTNWSGYLDTLRWFQQLENARWHPCFKSAVLWLMERDKYATEPLDIIIEGAGAELASLKLDNPYCKTSIMDLKWSHVVSTIEELSSI